jgi:hypothetical protein
MARGAIKRGTAREQSEHDAGYVASGEGEYSRHVASPGNVKMRGYAEPNPPGTTRKRGPREREELIAEQRRHLAKLHEKIKRENIPARFLKIKESIDIKARFIAKLESER